MKHQRTDVRPGVWTLLSRLFCRHADARRAFDKGRRIYLLCPECGHDSPGWETK